MRWEPGRGLIREELHLARLARSAAALGFSHDPRRIRDCLEAIEPSGGMLRVRLTLHADGNCELTQSPFEPLAEGTVWKLAIARTRIDKDDELVRHKTTRRKIYEAARAEYSAREADEVVLLNRDGLVCEGTITNVFLRGSLGILATPPLSAGLLPGVLRAELLAEGRAREAEITPDELERGEIYVGNSLRGLIPAKLTGTGS
jgi:4-amino-4-deoxychorismate lyase